MTSIIKLQAFSGVQDESPLCYLLQVDEFKFLLDCGWDEKFDKVYIKELKKHVNQVDAILLSYPDIFHLGALPYMVGKCGLSCPIYATIPVYKMGQMFMYDLFQSRHNSEDFDLFTLDDVDAAFDKIQQLKYSQNIGLKGKGHGLQITPLPAGHMIGGTIWRIVKEGEEDIVYAVDYNHKKERHLNGCVLESISRPSLLITDAYNATYVQARRRLRDEQLMTTILQTLRNNGNVLIAVDTAGRVLELAQLLDQLWRNQDSGLLAYSLALLNNVSYNVVEFAKSQVEWMSDKIMRSFEDRRNNPFQFRHLQLCHSMGELAKVPEPKVVLASEPDMECGFSRDLFLEWGRIPKNSIILTSRTSPGTLSRNLIENPKLKKLNLDVKKRIRLEGIELEEYLRKEKEKEQEAAAEIAKNILMDGIDSSDESDNEMEIDMTTFQNKGKHDLMRRNESKNRGGFFKQAKKSYPMFPVHEERIRWDDYGEIIKPEDYTIIELNIAEDDKLKENGTNADETVQDISEVPTKCVSVRQSLEIMAKVEFIDFEGRSDGESIRKIISQIKPRQLIIVHGSYEATQSLAEYCRSSAFIQGKVFTPNLHGVIDVTTESHIYQVKLKDSLVSSLMFEKAKDAELAWVDGQISLVKGHNLSSVSEQKPEEEEEDEYIAEALWAVENKTNNILEETNHVPVLDILPLHHVTTHSAAFINEPKLSDFKQVLMRHNIQAEFSGGMLICNNVIAVRKTETGRIGLEGCICEDYYKVRELLYSQYAIV